MGLFSLALKVLYGIIFSLSFLAYIQDEVQCKYVRTVGVKRYVGYVLFKKPQEESQAYFLMLQPEWQKKWVLPEGRVRFGESREKAVKRVLREETGIFTSEISLGTIERVLHPENKTTYWIALLCKNDKALKISQHYREHKWCAFDEAFTIADRLTKKLLQEARPYIDTVDFFYYI